jgi:hypothetical protein
MYGGYAGGAFLMPNVGNERLPKAVRSIDGVDFGAMNEATETRNEKLGAGILSPLPDGFCSQTKNNSCSKFRAIAARFFL